MAGREDGKKPFDRKAHFGSWRGYMNEHLGKWGKLDDRRHWDRSLTYSFPCAVFTVPSVAKYGVGQFPAECHVKVPQFDLTPFEFLPGPIVSPTGTNFPEGQKMVMQGQLCVPLSRE